MKKKISMLLVAMLFVLALVGCSTTSSLEDGSESNGSSSNSSDEVTIGLSVSTLNNPFFVTLRDGAQSAADAAGVKLIVADAQDDTAKQISDIEDMIQQKVDVLLINPTDSDAVVSAVESANEAKIPVITVDRAANGGEVMSHIASDNVKGGEMAGEYILELIGSKGNLVELQGIAGTSAANDRGAGFHNVVDGKDGVSVVASQPADFDRAKGLEVMENILQSNPDVQAVFAHNDEMALGALEAIKAANKDIKVVGFDATDDAVKSVEAGGLAATIAQKPADIGKAGVEAAVKVAKGETVDKSIPVDLELIKK